MRLYTRGKNPTIHVEVIGPDGAVVRKSTRCTDNTAAGMFGAELERQLQSSAYAAAQTVTLRDAFAQLLEHKELVEESSEHTLEFRLNHSRHLLRVFAAELGTTEPRLSQVTPALIDAYCKVRLRDGVVHHTVAKELSTLRQVLRRAKTLRQFHEDPDAMFPAWDAKYEPKKTWLTRAQANALLAQLAPPRAAQVAFMLGTAARWSESVRARRSHVDFAKCTVFIDGSKTERAHGEVPMPSIMHPLVRYALEHAPGEDLLFAPWDKNWRDIQNACRRAKVPQASANDFRRSSITWLREAGVPKEFAADILRHTDTTMLDLVYDQSSPAARAAVLERFLAGGQPWITPGGEKQPWITPEGPCAPFVRSPPDMEGSGGTSRDAISAEIAEIAFPGSAPEAEGHALPRAVIHAAENDQTPGVCVVALRR